jgi:hypothetical protein
MQLTCAMWISIAIQHHRPRPVPAGFPHRSRLRHAFDRCGNGAATRLDTASIPARTMRSTSDHSACTALACSVPVAIAAARRLIR